ncbi:MAG: hypothetical protein KJS97_00545 [Alphaproteobacteria bacterium]|nr:hypothetical protein [Alphaproteobacteria bacterium]
MARDRSEGWETAFVILVGGLASFSAYFAMYAFRKPFTAATFDAPEGWTAALDFKIALVIAQVIGYALSKAIGVKVISELGRKGRAAAILALIGAAWLALIVFAIAPPGLKVAAMFANGLPLGLIWGLVFSYLEGRRVTEVLGAVLCASFILSSGVVKGIGTWTMVDLGVPEYWMPAVTGALFFPVLAVSVWGLSVLPPPTREDEEARMRRAPMDASARRDFVAQFGAGLALLIGAYVLFTVARDFRDNFAAELWRSLGHGGDAAIFALSEAPVAAVALVALAAMMAIRSNRVAFFVTHALMALGALTIGAATLAFQLHWIDGVSWMVAIGAGLYVCYTPYNVVLFERLLAASHRIGTAGFLIYLADAAGYVGSVALMLYKNFAAPSLDWLAFFVGGAYATSVVSVVLVVASALYFRVKLKAS